MRETDNDRQVVQLVYEYRILSQEQLQRLMGKSRSRVQQILVRLYHHQYLDRLFLPVYFDGRSPTLYILDSRGIALLHRMGIPDANSIPTRSLSPLFLEHTLAINDVRIAVAQACQQHEWILLSWKTEAELKAEYDRVTIQPRPGKSQRVSLIPDSYFTIELPGRGVSHFFLELDRGTMTVGRFKHKVHAYVVSYKTGLYQKRYNAQGFRVLTVVDTAGTGRVEHLSQETAGVPGIGRRFWFARLSDLTGENILTESIWSIAGENEKQPLFKG